MADHPTNPVRNPFRRGTLRARMQALAAAAVGVTVAVAALVTFLVVRGELSAQVDAQLQTDLRLVTASSPAGVFVPQRVSSQLARFRQDVLEVVGPGGLDYAPATASGEPPIPVTRSDVAVAAAGSAGVSRVSTRTSGGITYRVETVGGLVQAPGGQSLAIVVAHPITDMVRLLDELRLVLILVSLAGVGVAAAAGYAVARATIRPIERLTAAAEHVAATQDLDADIDDDGDDEVGRLGLAFNAMLAALRSSQAQQAQLVSDAGHELRTPLTSLRTNVEVLMRVQDLPEVDRAELLADVEAQLGELTTLIGDLVELGRHEERQPEPTEVGLDGVVSRAVERARRRAHGVDFAVTLDAGAVRAQPALLERAVLNVLDNAVKWSPPGGTVTVTLRRERCWVLEVRDRGPGISAEDLPHVFDRFYRASAARSLPGSGLGLAIVAQVVAAHGGTVDAATAEGGGTLVTVRLPIVAEELAPPPWWPPSAPPVAATGRTVSGAPPGPAVGSSDAPEHLDGLPGRRR